MKKENTELLKTLYLSFKEDGDKLIREVFNSRIGKEYLESLKNISEEDLLVEIGHAFGDGDNGRGYYQIHLMLNLNNLKTNESLFYLVQKFVPEPDCGHEWEIKEFSELDDCNFSKMLTLLVHMNLFCEYNSCLGEIIRLSERKYSTCVNAVKEGGISFY